MSDTVVRVLDLILVFSVIGAAVGAVAGAIIAGVLRVFDKL